MISNNRVNDWLNKHFFVKAAKAGLVIVLVSAGLGLASVIYLDIRRANDPEFFLNRCSLLGGHIIKFIVALAVTTIMLLLISGLYNLFIRRRGQK